MARTDAQRAARTQRGQIRSGKIKVNERGQLRNAKGVLVKRLVSDKFLNEAKDGRFNK